MTATAIRSSRLTAAGRPTGHTVTRLPFVIASIMVMILGVGGVLTLNTKIDESGMRAEAAMASAAQKRLELEALDRAIAELHATPHLAARARALGMVPAGDAAMIVLHDSGAKPKIIGEPRAVTGPKGE